MKLVLALLGALLFTAGAHAQTPSSYALKDSNGVALNVGVFQCPTNKICPLSVSSDSAGNPLSGLAGTTNPVNSALYVQGVTNGVPINTSFSSPQHVICDSGCAGGGSGGNVNLTQILGVAPSASNPLWVSPATGVTFPISATALPLPTGAATQTTSAAILSALGSPFQTGGSIGNTSFGISGTLPAFAATPTFNIGIAPTIAVTGTFFQATQPVSISSTVPVSIAAPVSVTGTFFQTTQPVSIASAVAVTGTFFQATQPISASALPLPSGAATATLQGTGNTSIASIDTKTPALGQALAAASRPVVLPALQITALTPPTTVTVTQSTGTNLHVVCDSGCAGGGGGGTSSTFAATFPTTGTAAGMSQGGNMVALTGTSGNLNVQCANCSGSGVSTADGAAFTAGSSLFAGAGGIVQTTATSNPVTAGNQGLFQMTANRALFSNLRNASGAEIGVAAAPLQVSLANTGANATALLVTGTGGTFPVTGTVTANAGTNLNTSALALETGGNLASIATNTGRIPAQGQALAAASLPVVLTALQVTALIPPTTVSVTQSTAADLNATVVGTGTFAVQAAQSGTWNVTNISGTVSLPTGASTATLQGTGNTSLASIDTKTPALGQQLAAASTPVVLTALQLTSLTPLTSVTVTQATGTNLHVVCDSGCSGSGGTSSAFAAAFPANGTAIGAKNGSNMVNLTADASGNLNVNVQSALGTAIGATTAGSTGSGIMGAVTTSPPTYTTATTNFVSLDTAGNLRVDDTASSPTGAAVPASAVYGGGIALSAEPTAATTGNLIGSLRDLVGKAVTSPYANRENMVRGGGSSTTTTAITLMAAAGAGIKNYMTDLTCTRSDAGTTAVTLTLNDSSAAVIDIPNNGGGGGYTHTFNVPLVTAANTALTVTPGAGVTTLHCSASGFKGY